MALGTVLLCCLFILCVCGVLRAPFTLLRLNGAAVTCIALLTVALHAFPLAPIPQIQVDAGAIVLIVCLLVFTKRTADYSAMLLAVVCAFLAGACCVLLSARLPAPVGAFSVADALHCLTCTVFVYRLRRHASAALLYAALAPVWMDLLRTAADISRYGYAVLYIGSAAAFDRQIAGVLYTGALLCVFRAGRRRTVPPAA